ncbi:hypothetical protein FKG96_10000 [Olivibacter sp. LS-1]|uniref:hypothetical protein n=1 Tax=Olivibacter sp. LS-1 TaxID=2592345 RepID=UPI0011EAF95B|nr:hypothetical protein [Olivibacter sp. LS-1]QEL01126.1 hypothetical protein FKG96_10000 [Olivibacter sp. LS-1]
MNKEEKIEEIISRHLFSYGYERVAILKAMKEYAIAMCEAQKEACAEKISDLDVDALKTVLTTKNVAE